MCYAPHRLVFLGLNNGFKMKKVFKILMCGIALVTISACSIPTYQKSITSEYNANGELMGTTITETISQPSPNSSPMKVKITQGDLEK